MIYRSDRHGPPDVWEIAVRDPGSEKPLLELPAVQQPEDMSRDGRRLAYLNETATTVWNIFLLPLGAESKPTPWLPSRFSQTSPRFSPDGRWIAYESDESGAPEIYVALTEGGGQKRRILQAAGAGRGGARMARSSITTVRMVSSPVLRSHPASNKNPALLLLYFQVGPEVQTYDVMPNGSRFLVVLPPDKAPESPLR